MRNKNEVENILRHDYGYDENIMSNQMMEDMLHTVDVVEFNSGIKRGDRIFKFRFGSVIFGIVLVVGIFIYLNL